MTYDQFFGLSLNLKRVQGRLTFAFFQALNAANARRLPVGFFESVSDSLAEAKDRAFDYNASLAVQRAMAGKT